jgi:purine-binding chemotaxis protein CheW
VSGTIESRSVEPRELLEERAQLLAQPLASADEAERVEVVLFHSGGAPVAVMTEAVREAAPRRPAVPLPHMPEWVLGVINLRGEILPLIDLAALMGTSKTSDPEEIIVLHLGAGTDCAVPAAGAARCVTVEKDSIESAERLGKRDLPEWVQGLLRIDGRVATLIDPRKLFQNDSRILTLRQHSTSRRDR